MVQVSKKKITLKNLENGSNGLFQGISQAFPPMEWQNHKSISDRDSNLKPSIWSTNTNHPTTFHLTSWVSQPIHLWWILILAFNLCFTLTSCLLPQEYLSSKNDQTVQPYLGAGVSKGRAKDDAQCRAHLLLATHSKGICQTLHFPSNPHKCPLKKVWQTWYCLHRDPFHVFF